jgi:hypothetical protein
MELLYLVKRTHFIDPETNRVACGTPQAQPYHKVVNGNRTRLQRFTAIPDEVTCGRCQEQITRSKQVFNCPACKKSTDTFIVVESVIEKNIVYAKNRGRRHGKEIVQRILTGIICPLCNVEIPTTEPWATLALKLKV